MNEQEGANVLAAVLEADPHAVFLMDTSLKISMANGRAERLCDAKAVLRRDGERLAGRTNRVHVQLVDAVRALTRSATALPTVSIRPLDKSGYAFELVKLDCPCGPLVLLRVFERYAEPETSGATPLPIIPAPLNPVSRRLSADRKHGPAAPRRRSALPPLAPLQSFEAYARLGSMAAAAVELQTFPKTVSRHVRDLEVSTRRALVEGARHELTLTPAGRQLARALTDAFDLLQAAVRPRPDGRRRGRPPRAAAETEAELETPGTSANTPSP